MTGRNGAAVAAVACVLVTGAGAGDEITVRKLEDVSARGSVPMPLEPYAVAEVIGRTRDGGFILGEKLPYVSSNGFGPADYPPILYDNWGGDTQIPGLCSGDPTTISPANGIPSGGYGPPCDFSEDGLNCTGVCSEPAPCEPGLRWFPSPDAVWSSFIHQIADVAPGTAGVASYLKTGWYQAFGANIGIDGCGQLYTETVIVINIYNSTIGDQIGVEELDGGELADNFKDGIALFFGPVNTGGWYDGTIDLRPIGDPELYLGDMDAIVPGDAIETVYADTNPLDPNELILARYAQSMLWGPQDVSQQGASGTTYYVDGSFDLVSGIPVCANVPDGAYMQPNGGADPMTDDDFFDGTTLCPVPVSGMVGLYGDPVETDEICPDSGTILAGFEFEPGFEDVCESDDEHWVIQSSVFDALFAPAPIQVEFDGNVQPLGGSTLTFWMEGHPEFGGGTAFIQLRLFNYTTQSYVGMPFINQPDGTDQVYSFTVDNAGGDFIDGSGNVNAVVTFSKTAGGPVRGEIDRVYWTVE